MTKKEKKPNIFYRVLDPFFKFSERGSNIKTEIYAGILMFISVACTTLVCANLLSQGVGLTSDTAFNYALYFAIALASVIGSIIIGLVCNAPVVQSVSLGMVTLIVSTVSAYKGLSYLNVLAIAFISNVIYFLAMVIPPVRRFITNSVPQSIKKIFPAVLGAYLIGYTLVQLNVVQLNEFDMVKTLAAYSAAGDPISGYGINYLTFNLHLSVKELFYTNMPFITGLIGFALTMILRKFKVKHSVIIGFGGTLLAYIAIWAIRGKWTDYYLYAFITPAYGSMYYYQGIKIINKMFKGNYLFMVLKKGFDFTALKEAIAAGTTTGSFFKILLGSVLAFLVAGVSETSAAVTAVSYQGNALDENAAPCIENKNLKAVAPIANVYAVSALAGCVSLLLGAPATVVRAESATGSEEGGRTGLSAIVAGLLFIVTIFNLVFSGLFMNGIVVYGIMIFTGLSLLTALKNVNFEDFTEFVPQLAMVVIAAFTLNIGLAITVGMILDLVLKMLGLKFKDIKIGTYVLSAILLVSVIL